jgi:hypothetical protein
VPADKILSCWRHTLLTQDSPSGFNTFVATPPREKVVGQAESDLSKVIDTLVELGLLNTNNRISIEEYTDPPFERVVTLQKYTDPEIISLVRNEDASRDDDDLIDESKDEKPSIPVPANLAPINGHGRSQVAQNRTPQPLNHVQNLMESPHHHMFNHHLQHFQHPSHPGLILHPSHTMHAHNPAQLNTGTLPYIPNNQAGGLQKSSDDPASRKGEIWSVPQVLEALEEIGRFSMHRREPEWKEVPHMLARMARALKNEIGNPPGNTTAAAAAGPGGSPFNGYPHLQSPLLSASRVHSQAIAHATSSQAHPMAASHPLSNAHSNSQNSLSQHPSTSGSPHQHSHPHPHSHQSNPRPQSQPLTHSQSHPPSHAQSSQSQLLHSHPSASNQAQAQHLSQLHQQALTPVSKPNPGLSTPRPKSAHSPCGTGLSAGNSSNVPTHPAPQSTPSRPDHHHASNSLTPSQSANNPTSSHSQLSIDAITHPVDVNSN